MALRQKTRILRRKLNWTRYASRYSYCDWLEIAIYLLCIHKMVMGGNAEQFLLALIDTPIEEYFVFDVFDV